MKISKIVKSIAGALCACFVVLEILLIAVVVISKMSGNVPSVFGYNMFVIASGSMRPELEVGDVIISKAYDGGELAVGDVVQFISKDGDMSGQIITHKIISIGGEANDQIVTKGTANAQADEPICRADVLAVMKYKTAIIDDIYSVLNSVWGFVTLVMIPLAAMIVLEIVSIVRDIKKEIKEAERNEDQNQ